MPDIAWYLPRHRLRRDLEGAQARRMVEDLRGEHQFVRAGPLDELAHDACTIAGVPMAEHAST